MVRGTSPALAVKSATTTIPIVDGKRCESRGCRVGCQSGGREAMSPGSLRTELNTKRLEILKDAVPKLARVGLCGRRKTVRQLKESGLPLWIEAKIGGDRDSTRRQRFRERISNRKAEAGGRDHDDSIPSFSPKESGSSSLPANTGCRLFTTRRSLSMRAVSCPMGRTTMTSFRGRSLRGQDLERGRNRLICRCSRRRSLSL